MIRPLAIIFYALTWNPVIIKLLLKVPIKRAPTKMLIMFALPPNRLVPPRMTAAIAASSAPVPNE